jgi:hypothetical protein
MRACMKSGMCMRTCLGIHGDLARARMRTRCEHGENPETRHVEIQRACIGIWRACVHETLRACVRAGPACVCVHSWGPGANVDGDPACLRGGPGACVRGGDPVRVCGNLACARVRGGPACAWGSSGHGQESVPHMKVWEPACEAFTMQKSSVEKKKGNAAIAYLTACRGIKSACRGRGWGETERGRGRGRGRGGQCEYEGGWGEGEGERGRREEEGERTGTKGDGVVRRQSKGDGGEDGNGG